MKKSFIVLLALVLIVGIAVGGTVAWLTATSDTVTNTFTTSDIGVTLTESENLNLKIVPGASTKKDPKAKVNSGSEYCWLFVKIEEQNNTFDTSKKYVTYEIAEGWTQLTQDKDGNSITDLVYYRKVDGTTNTLNTDYSVLKDDKVTFNSDITKTNMPTAANAPKLIFTAYASQLNKNATEDFTAAEAWANISSSTSSTTPNP